MKRILAVDDEQDLLDVVSEFFAGRYDVVTATSGDAARSRSSPSRSI